VSVVVPVYNVAQYLTQCLESILNQSVDVMEVICVDDGSTDGSSAILELFRARDGRLRVIAQENRGLGAARNVGLQAAQGDYVYFLDSDDYVGHTLVEECLEHMEASKLDLLYFEGSVVVDDEDSTAPMRADFYQRKGEYPGVWEGQSLFVELMKHSDFRASACMQMVRREFLEQSGIVFPERVVFEDELYSLETLLVARRVAVTARAHYFRRIRAHSIWTSASAKSRLMGLAVVLEGYHQLAQRIPLSASAQWLLMTRKTYVYLRRMVFIWITKKPGSGAYRLVGAGVWKALQCTGGFIWRALRRKPTVRS
jgi:glycosyltransferase involved in cell wall biosynthesis